MTLQYGDIVLVLDLFPVVFIGFVGSICLTGCVAMLCDAYIKRNRL